MSGMYFSFNLALSHSKVFHNLNHKNHVAPSVAEAGQADEKCQQENRAKDCKHQENQVSDCDGNCASITQAFQLGYHICVQTQACLGYVQQYTHLTALDVVSAVPGASVVLKVSVGTSVQVDGFENMYGFRLTQKLFGCLFVSYVYMFVAFSISPCMFSVFTLDLRLPI